MISPNASNWVDRGEPAERKLVRVLRHFLDFAADEATLQHHADVLLAMVDADASEVQVAAYLGTLEDEQGLARSPARHRRLVAIAAWHVGKAALTRDAALRRLAETPREATSDRPPLSEWLAERLLRLDDA